MVERSSQAYPTEKSVQEAINKVIREQQNVTFVVSSAQNIDRLVSVVKACNTNKKKLVIDVYNAWVLDMVKKKAPNLPTIDWDNILVYNHPHQLEKIAGVEYTSFRERIAKNDIGNKVFGSPAEFVYFLRCPNTKLVKDLLHNGTINLIYSQWKGYLEEGHKTYCAETIQELADSKEVAFQHIHTSGHATLFDLKRMAKAMDPKKIVPIHTENPVKIQQEFVKAGFTNVELWDDGIEYQL